MMHVQRSLLTGDLLLERMRDTARTSRVTSLFKRRSCFSIVPGILIGIAVLLMFGISNASAQDGGEGGRFKIIETQSTEYLWNMVSLDGGVICQVTVTHEGIPTDTEAYLACKDKILALPTPTPGPQPTQPPVPGFNISNFFKNVRWNFVESRVVTNSIKIPIPELIVNLVAPDGPLTQPYVIITGFEPMPDYEIVSIHGILDGVEFSCTGARCEVPVLTDSSLTYWVKSSFGDESRHLQSQIRVTRLDGGYAVNISSVTNFEIYKDSCANIWGLEPTSKTQWTDFPATPEDLNSRKTLHYLADKLIIKGAVNTQDCPGGGLLYTGSPNACGLERAAQMMYDWQNLFDQIIWTTSRSDGIPPILLKSMIEQETQFWPENSRNGEFEYGLAQINQLGADVSLRWDTELYNQVCSGLLSDCSTEFGSLSSWEQAMLRGGLTRLVNAECPTCKFGIDLYRTEQSIPIIAKTLRANCAQAKHILNVKGAYATSYEDMWRFTMVSYHSGYQCLIDGVTAVRINQDPMDWEHLSEQLTCEGAADYVDALWEKVDNFKNTKSVRAASNKEPVLIPTFYPTAIPTEIVINPISSTIQVEAFLDSNGNTRADPGEMINNVNVTVEYFGGKTETQKLVNGQAVFDTLGVQPGTDVTISIPSLYRVYKTKVIKEGILLIIFRIEPPELPGQLP
jgi:hypothetical protein